MLSCKCFCRSFIKLVFTFLIAAKTLTAVSDADVLDTNVSYPIVPTTEKNEEKCSRHLDQTTSRANTLGDDADDLQKQLENEARDRLKSGRPKTIWVFHLPRHAGTNTKNPEKREARLSEEYNRNKRIFHARHYTDETQFSTELTIEPTTLDLEPLSTLTHYKEYTKKEPKPKSTSENNLNFINIGGKGHPEDIEKPAKKNEEYNNTDDLEHLLQNQKVSKGMETKHNPYRPTISITDDPEMQKLDNLVEKAKNISRIMPLTEGFNPDIVTNQIKKNKNNKKSKTEKKWKEQKPEFGTEFLKKQSTWAYKDQANWSATYPHCAGLRQSPISIPVQLLIKTKGARELCFDNFDVLPISLFMCVNECRLILFGHWEPKYWPTIYGGAGHSRRYKFHSLSAMWPSEHKIEGMLYPMETQFMFIGVEYPTIADALDAAMRDPQSVLIVATLYKFGKTIHVGAGDLLKSACESCNKCKCVPQELKPLSYFCPPFKKYACYYGSLSTPPCTESALWLIRAKALNITWDIYQSLLKSSTSGAFFTRDSQPLNDRKLFFFE